MPETVVHGRYNVIRALGGGGMARVYLAHDEVLGRDVALKVLRDQYAEDEEFAERFKREARSAASLSHPNIVSVYDRGVAEDGTSYIAMEHIPGGSLKERISRDGPLDPDDAAGVALQITGALEAAHEHGVIHRDIKPHNVLLTSTGAVKVADFGIARAAAATSISHTSLVLGTAGYMSPEQALGEPVDARSDLYSLGVVLYEMLTGELPYSADNPVAVSMKHVNEPLRPPKELNPEIPDGMNAVVTKLLSKQPGDRYESASELAGDLRRVRDGLPPLLAGAVNAGTGPTQAIHRTKRMPPVAAPLPGRARRARVPWVPAVILLLLALLAGLVWAVSQSGVEVPSVVGKPQEQAQQELETAGFRVEAQPRESSPEDAGKVLDQSPTAGTRVEEGSRVTIEVGSGPATVSVPEVRNMTRADAEAALAGADLTVGSVRSIPSNAAAPGIVVEQGYPPGTPVEPGSPVNLGVSSGPPAPAPKKDPKDKKDRQKELQEERKDALEDAKEEAKDKKDD